MTTTTARRITRHINAHARATYTKNASMGGVAIYFDADGHELTWHTLGERFAGAEPPEDTAYWWTVRPRHITTQAAVQNTLDHYVPGLGGM